MLSDSGYSVMEFKQIIIVPQYAIVFSVLQQFVKLGG